MREQAWRQDSTGSRARLACWQRCLTVADFSLGCAIGKACFCGHRDQHVTRVRYPTLKSGDVPELEFGTRKNSSAVTDRRYQRRAGRRTMFFYGRPLTSF